METITRTIRCPRCGRPIAHTVRATGFGTCQTYTRYTPEVWRDRRGVPQNVCRRCKG